jgi:hypothetical protein
MTNKRKTNRGAQATTTKLHLKMVVKKEVLAGKLTEELKEDDKKVSGTTKFSVRDGSGERKGTNGNYTEG